MVWKLHSAKRKLVVSDAVFSMDGDIAPLRELVRYVSATMPGCCSTMLMVSACWAQTGAARWSILMFVRPTLSTWVRWAKPPAYPAHSSRAKPDVIDWLVQRARTYVFSTGSPPALAVALLESLGIIERDDCGGASICKPSRRAYARV